MDIYSLILQIHPIRHDCFYTCSCDIPWLFALSQPVSVHQVGVWKLDTLHGPATYYYSMGRWSPLLLLLRPVQLLSSPVQRLRPAVSGLTRRFGRRTTRCPREGGSEDCALKLHGQRTSTTGSSTTKEQFWNSVSTSHHAIGSIVLYLYHVFYQL